MKTIVILLTTFMASIFNSVEHTTVYYQNCEADLSVEKDRNYETANEDGASFILNLKNTSSKTETYQLSTTNLLEACDNNSSGRSSGASNVTLDVSIVSMGSRNRSNDGITLNSGETYSFVVQVSVPKGTAYNSWSCIDVIAASKDCSNPAKTTLSVFVADPSED